MILLRLSALALAAAFGAGAIAQTPAAPAKKPKAVRKAPTKASPPVAVLPEADEPQRQAAELTHYGDYACEFNQTLAVARHATHPGYVDVRFGKQIGEKTYLVWRQRLAARPDENPGEAVIEHQFHPNFLVDGTIGERNKGADFLWRTRW